MAVYWDFTKPMPIPEYIEYWPVMWHLKIKYIKFKSALSKVKNRKLKWRCILSAECDFAKKEFFPKLLTFFHFYLNINCGVHFWPIKIKMFEDADNYADFFRCGLPYYLLFALPILIMVSSTPVLASSEFSMQRMSQFDVNGVGYGIIRDIIFLPVYGVINKVIFKFQVVELQPWIWKQNHCTLGQHLGIVWWHGKSSHSSLFWYF